MTANPLRRRRSATHALLLLPLTLAIVASLACAPRHGAAPLGPSTVLPDSIGLAEYAVLSDAERAKRRTAAAEVLTEWRLFSERNQELELWREQQWRHQDPAVNRPRPYTRGGGLLRMIDLLERAVGVDPGDAATQADLGRSLCAVGRRERALDVFESAIAALGYAAEDERDPAAAAVCLDAAWACHGLGHAQRGLDWLARTPASVPATDERLLARGLLLADAGRTLEARRAAVTLGAVEYRYYGTATSSQPNQSAMGIGTHLSGYAARWIDAMACLADGDAELAWHALGMISPERKGLPWADRYWQDVGLIAELTGRADQAQLCYGLAFRHGPHRGTFPAGGGSCPPLIDGRPQVVIPYFITQRGDLIAGSPFSFAAKHTAQCALIEDPGLRAGMAARSAQALDLCLRRGIFPARSRILRGRALYFAGAPQGALADLGAVRDSLARDGRVDARTSHLLGLIRLDEDDPAGATPFLREAVHADPALAGAWQSLGAALAAQGGDDEALAAFDRALAVDPQSVSCWYNRGLFHLQRGRADEAYADLGVALQIAPDNPRTLDLITRATADLAPDSGRLTKALARRDSLAASLPAPGAPDSVLAPPAPEDHRARATALGRAFKTDPTPGTRRDYAEALYMIGRLADCRKLLLADWPAGLSDQEKLIVLKADRELGDADRARELVASLPESARLHADPMLWALTAMNCLDFGYRAEGLTALEEAIRLDDKNPSLLALRRMLRRGD